VRSHDLSLFVVWLSFEAQGRQSLVLLRYLGMQVLLGSLHDFKQRQKALLTQLLHRVQIHRLTNGEANAPDQKRE